MPALSFGKEFCEGVANGVAQAEGRVLPFPGKLIKRQTIRAKRKRPIVIGDDLYLYYAMRTKSCCKLGKVTCEMVRPIWIDEDFVEIEGMRMDVAEVEDLAVADGFACGREMVDWFEKTHGLPFFGQWIEW